MLFSWTQLDGMDCEDMEFWHDGFNDFQNNYTI